MGTFTCPLYLPLTWWHHVLKTLFLSVIQIFDRNSAVSQKSLLFTYLEHLLFLSGRFFQSQSSQQSQRWVFFSIFSISVVSVISFSLLLSVFVYNKVCWNGLRQTFCIPFANKTNFNNDHQSATVSIILVSPLWLTVCCLEDVVWYHHRCTDTRLPLEGSRVFLSAFPLVLTLLLSFFGKEEMQAHQV